MAKISPKGIGFLVRHEGFVSKAYRDVGGVWTIGTGFTNRSAVAKRMIGKISAGKTITRAKNDKVLAAAIAEEYGPPVVEAMPDAKQHELDAGYSYCFNCGPGAMGDVWVGMWRGGDKDDATERLKKTRVTAGGNYVQGLANRREAEAKLLRTGDYGPGVGLPPAQVPDSEYWDKLNDLGYTKIVDFQKNHPNLKNDDIMGPATRAQIDREVAARKEAKRGGVPVAVGLGFAGWLAANGSTVAIVAIAIGLVGVGIFAIRRREEIAHWIKDRKDR